MSSDETEDNSPVLPRDSDRGSSVSSLLQDEYEELLRSAVVTPRLDAAGGRLHLLGTPSLRLHGSLEEDDDDDRTTRRRPAAGLAPEAEDGRHSSRSVRSPRVAPQSTSRYAGTSARAVDRTPAPLQTSRQAGRTPTPSQRSRHTGGRTPTPSQRSRRTTARTPSPSHRSRQTERTPSPSHRSRQTERTPSPSHRSRQSSPKPSASSALLTELFICEENISQMENLLDTWSLSLKSNVVEELRRWRLLFIEQHNQEVRREKDKVHVLHTELEGLKQLLEAYQTSSQRKDQVIVNLTQALERQKEKVEMMRTLTHWRTQHAHIQEEAQALRRAEQHHQGALKRKAFLGWHSLLRGHWKEQVERDCRSRAQEVCSRLAAQYEAKIVEHCQAVEQAQVEVERLRAEKERYEEAMKKAFMRGVCALNMEALSMFSAESPGGGAMQQEDTDEADSALIGQFSSHPESSTHFSPAHFDPAGPPSQNAPEEPIDSRTNGLPCTTAMHSSLPLGGTASSQRQLNGRVVTAAQQKPFKTVTARITARPALTKTTRPDLAKTTRSHLHVMGVAPPMSSIMVERHHPVTQLTVGQATAAMFPRSAQQQQQQQQQHHHHHSGGPGGKPPLTRTLPSSFSAHSCDAHAIKIVD